LSGCECAARVNSAIFSFFCWRLLPVNLCQSRCVGRGASGRAWVAPPVRGGGGPVPSLLPFLPGWIRQ
jgi:hypothetical protein